VKQYPFFRRFITKVSGENIRAKMPENPPDLAIIRAKVPEKTPGQIDLTING
jgi:hypothetical protein